LLEIVRFQPEFLKIAEAVIRRERVQLLDHACPDPWNEAQRFSFTDSWQARWGAILLQYGEDLKYFPHKWLRVGAGSLSMPRTTFQSLGFFDETLAAMEDWELGARAQERGYSIVCAPEAEPLHQIHSVSEERVQAETQALTPLEQKHPEVIQHLRRASPDLIPPGGEQFVSLEFRAKHIEQRLKSSIATKDPSGCDEFVLSFDDGPHYQNTNLVLDGLNAVGAPGVFLVLGNRVKHNAEVLRRCSQEGHEIGIHGWYHRSWSRLTCAEISEEISRTIGQVEDIIGSKVNYCRPPYGNLPEHAAVTLSDLGLQVIGWNLSSRDWLGYSSSELVIELASQSLRGKVLLFHDGFGEPASTAAVVRWLVPAARRAGLRSLSISDYLKKYVAPECGAVSPPRLLQPTCP
jgi:peptidoglycan/xylan/chitin deacetylase (PgdA/CDA1 family)